jgi:hypothetical protein
MQEKVCDLSKGTDPLRRRAASNGLLKLVYDGNRLLHNLPHAFVGMSNADLVKISYFKNGNKTFQNEVALPRFDHEAFALIIY